MRNRIIFLFFLAAMLCFGVNDVKAQNLYDDFYEEKDGYLFGYIVTKVRPTLEVAIFCADYDEDIIADTQLVIPETATDENGIEYIVTSIYEEGFADISDFIGIQFPNSLKKIDYGAFKGCSGLSGELILSENISKIDDYAFYGCPISAIVFSEKLESIGDYAFSKTNVKKLIFPNKLESIGKRSFESCSSLTEVIFPTSLTEIKNRAFNKTKNLITIKCNATKSAELEEYALGTFVGTNSVNDNLKIYVPYVALESYYENWYQYEDYIVALPTFVEDGSINYGDNWLPNGVPASNTDVFINAKATIGSTESFTTNTFGICEDGEITIEEGGQLIHNGSEDVVTVKKSIAPYVIGEDGYLASGWYTISSPFGDLQLSSSNFIKNNYELFRYNESIYEWENHKNPEHVNDFTTLEAGRGYIYANAAPTDISITERLNTERKTYKMTASSDILKGFNLVGNPFMHNIYKGSGCAIDNGNLAEGFYTLSNEGAWHAKHNDPIKPMESILVKTTTAGTLYINKKTNSSAARALNNGLVTINVSNEKHNDVAYVTFNGGIGLDKINHRNSSIPMVYVPVDNVNYAIAVMDKEVTEIPVSFEAMSMGEYTISVSSTACNYDEITLIDKQTGEETNMLAGDYKFLATTNDNPERFLIKVSINENTEAEFFTDGSSIIINNIEGSGVVQIFDVMGRLVIKQNTNDSNCQISSSEMANGVYVVSLTDDNGTTTKKILINNK